ncbi:MAG: magnesium chelatase, partial [Candidatus Riflebacteria bacterium]|nr:magnesium chelatase [Candidatus Riflebacteria bacterium]
ARAKQKNRNTHFPLMLNAHIPNKLLNDYCELDNDAKTVLLNAARKFSLSARGYDKIIRIARTIADLSEDENIKLPHIAEALQYRTADLFSS